jgi:hypothetical protein
MRAFQSQPLFLKILQNSILLKIKIHRCFFEISIEEFSKKNKKKLESNRY